MTKGACFRDQRLAVKHGVAGGVHLRGEYAQYLEGQERVGLHEGGVVVAGDEAELCAAAGDGGKRIGLIANEGGESEDRAGGCLEGDDRFSRPGTHGESGIAFVENVKAGGGVSLAEENALRIAGDG